MKKLIYRLNFLLIRAFTLPFILLPYRAIHSIGRCLGTCLYYLYPNFRKRTLSNLALALKLPEPELVALAKKSLQNLMITCLEYAKFSWDKDIHNAASCENPAQAEEIIKKGQGIIFFCGHQSNWEVLFLDASHRMPGIAIGRPVKNSVLYDWITKIRQKYGGKMIAPQNAIWEGMRALKQGKFIGIVGDQGMPNSGFRSPFFGLPAWTSPIPALLSYRTGCPVMVTTVTREKGRYRIHYSDPIWPNKEMPQEQEVERIMKEGLHLLESSIRSAPDQWLWQHNRWKQQTTDLIKRAFRQDSILIVLPQDKATLEKIKPHLATFRELYPLEFMTIMAPDKFEDFPAEFIFYQKKSDLFIRDFRFKLVFNLTDDSAIEKHFLKLGAVKTLSLKPDNLSSDLRKAVLRAP